MTKDPEFKGYIHDVGGPTADFRHPSCDKQLTKGVCQNRQCLFPTPCPNLKADHQDYVELLRKLRKLPKVKKVFIRSGIRFDYLMADQSDTFFRELVLTDTGSPGHLPVDEDILIVHLCQHIIENCCQLVFSIGNIDLDQTCAVEKTVQMIFQGEDLSISC